MFPNMSHLLLYCTVFDFPLFDSKCKIKQAETEEAQWKTQPFKVKATYMNIYSDIWYTNH